MEVLRKNLSLNTVLITEGIRTEGNKAGNGSPNILQEKRKTLYSTKLLFLLVLIWARWSPSSLGVLFNGNYLGNWSVIRKIVILFSFAGSNRRNLFLFSSLLSFPFLLFSPVISFIFCAYSPPNTVSSYSLQTFLLSVP